MKLENTHGGRREGAGRKGGVNQTPILLKLDNDLLPFIKAQANRNRFINDCIRQAQKQ